MGKVALILTEGARPTFAVLYVALVAAVALTMGCHGDGKESICLSWRPAGEFCPALINKRSVDKLLQRTGFGGARKWLVRRNRDGSEVYVVLLEKPFGGLIVRESSLAVIRSVEGPWVQTSQGQLLVREPSRGRLLRFCPPLAKRFDVEQDWQELIQSMGPSGQEKEQDEMGAPRPFCVTVDPTASFFAAFELRLCSTSGESALLEAEMFGSRGNKVVYAGDSFATGIALGNCNGDAVIARWRGRAKEEDSILDLVLVGFGENNGQTLRVTKGGGVKSNLLRRPVEVNDIDPTCTYLLLAKPSASEPGAHWYTVEIANGKAVKLGQSDGHGLFVQNNWARAWCTSAQR